MFGIDGDFSGFNRTGRKGQATIVVVVVVPAGPRLAGTGRDKRRGLQCRSRIVGLFHWQLRGTVPAVALQSSGHGCGRHWTWRRNGAALFLEQFFFLLLKHGRGTGKLAALAGRSWWSHDIMLLMFLDMSE